MSCEHISSFLAHLSTKCSCELLWTVLVCGASWIVHCVSCIVNNCFKWHLIETVRPVLLKLHINNTWMVLYQNCSNEVEPCRILVAMATKSKNFKNLLLRNQWKDLTVDWHKWSSIYPVPKLLKQTWSVNKWGSQRDGAVFPVMMHMNSLKIFCTETNGLIRL